ncbi:hypothetical protein F3Y22_tig00000991pilonHSYRG00038 [Hibiscus syriacus]|uniref:Uncharacterized protein n=1 Tax=Hibiscus syriacus TaxID=106335 RepID=A0A6A3CWL7_HIBSY|nr:uncharacterized protein LOC120119101 isoform X2 [Hibiscus syriacus]KAE8733753.1 hypothetical protein F3Y22_tig00000991pilonHSYRG00038 [Hibiscus syriacus]
MTSFSGLGIGLSLVFGCLLLALVAELYYLLWWKKRLIGSSSQVEENYTKYEKELVHFFCWKKSDSLHASTNINNNNNIRDLVKDQAINGVVESNLELGSSKDFVLKGYGEEGIESELMRLHNLAGPPRFLFTIQEETKEDLDSEDGQSRTRSLSDRILTMYTPMASPPPMNPLDSYHRQGFNPLFESSTDAELNKTRSPPPPKLKFLRDAEEKLLRRLMVEAEKKVHENGGPLQGENIQGSFLKFIVDKNLEPVQCLPQYPSSPSQILPFPSSTTTFRTLDKTDTMR